LQDHAQPDDALRARGLAADKYRELTFTVVPVASRSQ
jgi:polyisoprenoid-binding protein YceI